MSEALLRLSASPEGPSLLGLRGHLSNCRVGSFVWRRSLEQEVRSNIKWRRELHFPRGWDGTWWCRWHHPRLRGQGETGLWVERPIGVDRGKNTSDRTGGVE